MPSDLCICGWKKRRCNFWLTSFRTKILHDFTTFHSKNVWMYFRTENKKKINKITERKNKYVLEDCMQIGSTNSRSRFDSGLLPQKYPIDVDLLSVSHFPYVCILCTNNILWLLDKCETLFFHIFPFAFVVVAVECQLHE